MKNKIVLKKLSCKTTTIKFGLILKNSILLKLIKKHNLQK